MQFKLKILLQSTIMVTISLLLMVILCYFSAKSFLLNNQINLSGENFSQSWQMADSFKVLIENIVYSVVTQPDFAAIVDNKKYQTRVLDELDSIRAMNLNIAGMHLYTYNGIGYNSDRFSSYYTLNDYLMLDQYNEFLNSQEVSAWMFNNIDEDKIIFTCKIFRENKEVGFVQTDIRLETFLGFFNAENQDSSTLIYYAKENSLLTKSNIPNDDRLKYKILEMIAFNQAHTLTEDRTGTLFCHKFIHDSLYIIKYESLNSFFEQMNRLKIIFIAISLLLLLGINMMYYQLIGNLMDSLRSLGKKIRSYHH